ncbi:MlaD family protein [Phyllobacterium sp. YR531]|uniref:MlaD family protein n=1 Tax=Phyllobacterium sp. YR531 TaxID=1144343 RepID=UPI00026F52F6|nr:MlaD family protein [Phyllobacterium sp. YR531]EJM98725.1 ABC-type transport system involved in resistance to organic solvents, periplasmic component [Phyllobacterium sp. YR531]
METKANYFLVAVFTLIVALLAGGFFYWIGRYGDRRDTATLEIRVPGSVTGLNVKSPVFFNGLKVGDVTRLFIDGSNPEAVIVQTEIVSTTPITRSTVATLAFEILAGAARIELTGGKSYEPKLLEEAAKEDTVARVDVDPTSLKTLVQTAQDWIERVDKATDVTEKYIEETRGPLLESVRNAKAFSEELASSTETIDEYGRRAQKLESTMHDARDVISRVNEASTKVDDTLRKVDEQLSDARDSTVSEIRGKLVDYQNQAKELNKTLQGVANNLANLTGEKLRNAQKVISESRRAVENIERGVSNFQDNPQKMLFGDDNTVPEYAPKR